MTMKDFPSNEIREAGSKYITEEITEEITDTVNEGIAGIQTIVDGAKRLSVVTDTLRAQVDSLTPLQEANHTVKEQLAMVAALQNSLDKRLDTLESHLIKLESTAEKSANELVERISSNLRNALDQHLSDVRVELRDTRESVRDRLDTSSQHIKQELADIEARLTAEMPRTIFGKRGS